MANAKAVSDLLAEIRPITPEKPSADSPHGKIIVFTGTLATNRAAKPKRLLKDLGQKSLALFLPKRTMLSQGQMQAQKRKRQKPLVLLS